MTGLVAALGGPPTPGIGFALGVDRVLLACDAEGVFNSDLSAVQVFVVDTTGDGSTVVLCDLLRQAGFGVARAFDNRSMKAQMKRADRSGARVAVIVGPDEQDEGSITVRDLRKDAPQRRVRRSDLVRVLSEIVAS